MRELARVEKITGFIPLYLKGTEEEAENIILAEILGWRVVVKKNEFQIGELVTYIEVDSKVDLENEAFQFLEKRKGKVKTMKLSKFETADGDVCISQGLAVPLDNLFSPKEIASFKEGQDLTEKLNIKKIENTQEESMSRQRDRSKAFYQRHAKFFRTKFGKFLARRKWFKWLVRKFLVKTIKPIEWPEYIIKTDETRIQNRPSILREFAGVPMIVTEKLHGTSTTFGLELKGGKKKEFDFAVCSRNVRMANRNQKTWHDDEVNYYWEMAIKYNAQELLEKLFASLGAKKNIVLQGETVGPSLLGNTLKLEERKMFAFNIIVDGNKLNSVEACKVLAETQQSKEEKMEWVPILDDNFILPETVAELVKFATNKSAIYTGALREGLVIRDHGNEVSFKVISPEWLLKNDND